MLTLGLLCAGLEAEVSASGLSSNETLGACARCKKISANQVAKNPRPVEILGRGKGQMMGMSESEWDDRLELAALGR